ncbi:MAG: hypothetical protein ACKV0T_11335 [Planctomycetales bacterium]
MNGCRLGRVGALVVGIVVWSLAPWAVGGERFELRESIESPRVFKTTAQLQVTGKLYTVPDPNKGLKLEVNARFTYDERRLEGTGREGETLRSLRHYEQASASIEAGGQQSNQLLRERLSLIVAQGKANGVEVFSPSGPLTYGELELLRTPGDSLAALALLPDAKVELTEPWKPADWVLPLLTGIDAAEKSSLTCRLQSVEKQTARVRVDGEITGVVLGGAATIQVTGYYLYDLEHQHLRRIELNQTEKRSIGPVSPGLEVAAKISLTRTINAQPQRLTEKLAAELPLEGTEANRLLMFDAPAWNVRFYHDRHWHLFHQGSELAILRLLDQGGLISQCNIKRLPDASPGEHVAEQEFMGDIETSLGKNFGEFVQSEKLQLRDGLFVYRVIAAGTVDRKNDKGEPVAAPMSWAYYLVANRDGRQISFVFTMDPKLSEELRARDLSIVGGIEFLPAKPRLTLGK